MSERTLQALRGRINARLQTSAISRDRASAAGREVVAQCRQSDVETLEWVLSEIDAVLATPEPGIALLRTPSGEGEAWRAFLDALDEFEAAVNLWVDPEGPTAADMERLRQSRQRVIECARALTALHPEAQGEEDAVRRTWELAVQRAYGCLDYCGGYRGAELKAFHSGIKTVIRALEAGLDTVDTQTAALDRIGAALRGEGGE